MLLKSQTFDYNLLFCFTRKITICYNLNMIHFKERLIELRNEKRLNQREFAKIFNITQPTVCHWEKGDREPDFEMLEKLCQFFDVSADYLLGIEDESETKINTKYNIGAISHSNINMK